VRRRAYYSIRTGRHKDGVRSDLVALQRLLRALYLSFVERCYFQEAFGYYRVGSGEGPGSLGADIEAQLLLAVRKSDLWPVQDNTSSYSEDDCFDVIEFLWDNVSKPVDGTYNSFGFWDYHTFNQQEGREEFREAVNAILRDYESGWELSEDGEILALADEGLEPLLEANLPSYDPSNVERRVEAAIRKFRRHGSTVEDRRDAVRDLADILEFLRPKAAEHLLTKKDENDLFQIANRFAIRHHDGRQKGEYNIAIWYSWMFYVYLATIHAAVSVIKQAEGH